MGHIARMGEMGNAEKSKNLGTPRHRTKLKRIMKKGGCKDPDWIHFIHTGLSTTQVAHKVRNFFATDFSRRFSRVHTALSLQMT
jgi:hypothetical protein